MNDIGRHGPAIKKGLREFLADKRRTSDRRISWGGDALERLEPFATSGKLLRGSVLCWTYETFSGKARDDPVLYAAMGLELTHSALLIHDDIMDGDPERRGRPSMHRQYTMVGESAGSLDGNRFGVNMAMSVGDAALFLAFELLARAAHTTGGDQAHALYVEQLLTTCAGQMQDVHLDASPRMPTKRQILDLTRAKTAAYTLALPLMMGAVMAGASPASLRRLKSIGIAGGTIFQIRDDELGIMGDAAKTGKPVGSDIRENKKTLLYYHLFKSCTPPERERLKMVFGNPSVTGRDISWVRGLADKHGISRVLGEEIEPLQAKAIKEIGRLPISAKDRDELGRLIAFCAARQY